MLDLSHFGSELTDAVKQVLRTGDLIYKFFEQTDDVIVPPAVQLIMFAMIWLKLFDDTVVMENIPTYRQNLIKAAQDPKNKALFDKLVQVDIFNDLLAQINKNKQVLVTLATTTPQTNNPPPATPIQNTTNQNQKVS